MRFARLVGCLVVVILLSLMVGVVGANDDGRLSSPGWDYYTVYCATDMVDLYLANGQLVKQIGLAHILGIPVDGYWSLDEVMTVHREQDAVTIFGANGNGAPQTGSRTFSLTECLERNGRTPQPAAPPDLTVPAVAPVTALPTVTGNPCVHEVQAGETAYAIIAQYAMTLDELISYNDLLDPAFLTVGQQLTLPGCAGVAAGLTLQSVTSVVAATAVDIRPADAVIHQVGAGEMLAHIALKYGVAVEAIINANAIADANMIWEGQELYIPGVSSADFPAEEE